MFDVEDQIFTISGGVDEDGVTAVELAAQQVLGQLVLDEVLDDAAQRAGAVDLVVALLAQDVLGRLGDLDGDGLFLELLDHRLQLQVDDLADLVAGQGVEDHRRVDAVQELGPEALLDLGQQLVLHPLVTDIHGLGGVGSRAEADGTGAFPDEVGADVGGHDDDGVPEIHAAALGVGQMAVVEDLEQDVEHVGMGFLDLVQAGPESNPCGGRPRSVGRLLRSRRSREARRRGGTRRISP